MTKNKKKLWITLGVATTFVMPATLLISCGTNNNKPNDNKPNEKINVLFYDLNKSKQIPHLKLDLNNYKKQSKYNKGKLTIKQEVTEIAGNVFNQGYPKGSGQFSQIKELSLPINLLLINPNAFQNSVLTSLTLPDGQKNDGLLNNIGDNAFQNSELTKLDIPDSVEKIGAKAFQNSTLTNLTIGKSVKSIGVKAFANSKLTSLIIPNEVKSIGQDAFSSIVNAPATTVTMPSRFNTKNTKDKIFGKGNWEEIKFNQN